MDSGRLNGDIWLALGDAIRGPVEQLWSSMLLWFKEVK